VSATELEARTATAGRYYPNDPNAPMIGIPDLEVDSPIFDSISAWFTTEPAAAPAPDVTGSPAPVSAAGEAPLVIDLREDAQVPALAQQASGSGAGAAGRWAALGDQEWLATNARAAASPTVAGNTEAGLPRRQPGANLLPSAAEAAPAAPTVRNVPGRVPASTPTMTPSVAPAAGATGPRPDPESVRGRLGSYQRGLTSARRARHLPGEGTTNTRPALGEPESRQQDAGQQPAEQGGDH
jgi:hypothetical protein